MQYSEAYCSAIGFATARKGDWAHFIGDRSRIALDDIGDRRL
ncbi:hypothetical protein [Scytonema sp. HK-05]|nr:hypothetical protein [Scytonema sp. HK-05]